MNKNLFSGFRLTAIGLASLCWLGTGPAHAAVIVDAANDFLPSYTGPKNGDLDVLSAQVFYDGTNFTFTSTLNGLIGTTPGALYVWGIDRGAGTAGFPTIAPGVTFDALFLITPGGTSTVRDLKSGVATNITNVTVSGSTVTGVVAANLLPSPGSSPSSYLVNLWPRSGAGGLEVISDFAPNNSDALVTSTATPEPGTLSLFGLATTAGLVVIRRRKHT